MLGIETRHSMHRYVHPVDVHAIYLLFVALTRLLGFASKRHMLQMLLRAYDTIVCKSHQWREEIAPRLRKKGKTATWEVTVCEESALRAMPSASRWSLRHYCRHSRATQQTRLKLERQRCIGNNLAAINRRNADGFYLNWIWTWDGLTSIAAKPYLPTHQSGDILWPEPFAESDLYLWSFFFLRKSDFIFFSHEENSRE